MSSNSNTKTNQVQAQQNQRRKPNRNRRSRAKRSADKESQPQQQKMIQYNFDDRFAHECVDQDLSLCLPHVHILASEHTLAAALAHLGRLAHIDLSVQFDQQGVPFFRAFAHFHEWFVTGETRALHAQLADARAQVFMPALGRIMANTSPERFARKALFAEYYTPDADHQYEQQFWPDLQPRAEAEAAQELEEQMAAAGELEQQLAEQFAEQCRREEAAAAADETEERTAAASEHRAQMQADLGESEEIWEQQEREMQADAEDEDDCVFTVDHAHEERAQVQEMRAAIHRQDPWIAWGDQIAREREEAAWQEHQDREGASWDQERETEAILG